jgi:hypothetical protein
LGGVKFGTGVGVGGICLINREGEDWRGRSIGCGRRRMRRMGGRSRGEGRGRRSIKRQWSRFPQTVGISSSSNPSSSSTRTRQRPEPERVILHLVLLLLPRSDLLFLRTRRHPDMSSPPLGLLWQQMLVYEDMHERGFFAFGAGLAKLELDCFRWRKEGGGRRCHGEVWDGQVGVGGEGEEAKVWEGVRRGRGRGREGERSDVVVWEEELFELLEREEGGEGEDSVAFGWDQRVFAEVKSFDTNWPVVFFPLRKSRQLEFVTRKVENLKGRKGAIERCSACVGRGLEARGWCAREDRTRRGHEERQTRKSVMRKVELHKRWEECQVRREASEVVVREVERG